MKTKLLALALAVVLCLALAVPAAADTTGSGTCGNRLTWALDAEGVLTIRGTGAMTDYLLRGSPWYAMHNSILEVVIDSGVTSVGNYAFYQCGNLQRVRLPDSLLSIGDSAFLECASLENVTIPYGVTTIGEYAFCTCGNLSEARIPDTVTEIGKCAFSQCESLAIANLPRDLTRVENNLFSGCRSLNYIDIPNNVVRIGNGAFNNCALLTSLWIPASVTEIGSNTFEFCSSLRRIDVDTNNRSFRSADGVLYNNDMTELICCPGAFSGGFAVPTSVKRIWSSAFQSCIGMTRLSIPESVTEIGAYALNGCEKLSVLRLPSGLTSIPRALAADCHTLTSVYLPAGITRVEEFAFYDCQNLRDVYFDGSEEQWKEVKVEDYNDCLFAAKMHFNAENIASSSVTVTVNGVPVRWTDVTPFIDANNRTMVPFRAVADALGVDVDWDDDAREAVFSSGDKVIYFPIGSNEARTSDEEIIEMDTAAVIVNNRTFAPARALAEYFGYTVGWNARTYTVLINQ